MTLARTARRRTAALRTAIGRLPDPAASAVAVAALLGINLAAHLLDAPWWVAPAEAVVLLAFARVRGLGWAELGLGRERAVSGARWGLGAIGVVVAAYLVGLLLPLTRPAFQDDRYHVPLGDALWTAFVVIPLGTVVLEEIGFRSVLWGLLARHLRPWQVLVATSALFGLWHVLPSLHLAEANRGVSETIGGAGSAATVAATVAFTALGGLVFGGLRWRSGSVLAAAGAHWATNALGVLAGLLAWRMAG